jgi:hypothetical protein
METVSKKSCGNCGRRFICTHFGTFTVASTIITECPEWIDGENWNVKPLPAPEQVGPEKKTCEWKGPTTRWGLFWYKTSCGHGPQLDEIFKFDGDQCPFCGKPIKVICPATGREWEE